MSDEPPPLRLEGIRKSYGSVAAIDDISLTVGRAEVVGLLGPNGAGKSTLFQIASGLFVPDAGRVEVFGRDYRPHAREILGRLGVVFQTRSLDLEMTVRANLKFHGGLFGLSGAKLRQRISETTELLGIAPLANRPVRTLSGGNQRRVEIARALLNDPDLLLMDEPTVGLDAATRRGLTEHMATVSREGGTAILWATHLVEEVTRADRVALMIRGKMVRIGPPAQLMAETGATNLTDAYIALSGLILSPAAEVEMANG